jgi:hypothetical protein
MHSGSFKIYSSSDSPRLRYIAGIILGDILGLQWDHVTDKRKLGKHPVLNYSNENIKGAFNIIPVPVLFEKGIRMQHTDITSWMNLPVFFQTPLPSNLPFDIFAASFFLVSRYEEYLEFTPDVHGRFPATSSFAFKHGFLNRPVVDLWAREFAKALLRIFPALVFRRNEYKACLTIDTDQPFAFRGKNIFKFIGGLIQDKKNEKATIGQRYRIINKAEKDPFDVFEYITGRSDEIGSDTRFFFPVGDRSKYDRNPSWKNEEYRKLIRDISVRYQTGLHPSYKAGGNGPLINSEVIRLNSIIKKEINICRFHYIRIRMPHSYRQAIKAGISEDYSMGYPDETGFRAGISRPYYFYDVEEDCQTSLKIIPFQVMDATLFDYKKLTPDLAIDIISSLINETRKAGGLFVSIWHNTSLVDNDVWRQWRKVFEFVIKNQQP